mgnify:CR=1 FL=1
MVVKDLNSIKKVFKKIKTPIFGAGVFAFARLGPEEFIPDYHILSLYFSQETKLIERDIPLFCLEKEIGKRLRPRNSSTLLCHPKTKIYLSKFKNPLILTYRSSKRMEKTAKENGWKIAISPWRFGKIFLENKVRFRKVLEKIKVPPTPGRIISFSSFFSFSFSDFKKEFGIPFVIQHPKKGGGKGTFFIKNDRDFKKVREYLKENKARNIIVAKYIKGPSPSITGCVTRFGILSCRPQFQICDVKILYNRDLGSGLFCGHDWSASEFPKKVLNQAKEIVEKVGLFLQKIGYKGIFGLDFVLDKKTQKLYLTECNPRLLGSFPTLTMIQLFQNEPPLIAFHLLEFLDFSGSIDKRKIENQLWQKKEGAQMILHNPRAREAEVKGEVKPGIYRINLRKKEKFIFVREGYKFSHLQRKDEFLITDGVPFPGQKLNPYQRICRILTQDRVLKRRLNGLLFSVEKKVKVVLKKFKIV